MQNMRAGSRVNYFLQQETVNESHKLGPVKVTTRAQEEHARGVVHGEPLLVAMDALLRYAKAYRKEYDGPLADDGVLGRPWLEAAKGVRALLNGQGAVAMEFGQSTDSKDNGVIEGVFWSAIKAAGFTEGDF